MIYFSIIKLSNGLSCIIIPRHSNTRRCMAVIMDYREMKRNAKNDKKKYYKETIT